MSMDKDKDLPAASARERWPNECQQQPMPYYPSAPIMINQGGSHRGKPVTFWGVIGLILLWLIFAPLGLVATIIYCCTRRRGGGDQQQIVMVMSPPNHH